MNPPNQAAISNSLAISSSFGPTAGRNVPGSRSVTGSFLSGSIGIIFVRSKRFDLSAV